MKKNIIRFTLIVFLSTNAQIKILFDATKAEMAGNADWVIDADSKSKWTNLITEEFLLPHKRNYCYPSENLLERWE